MHEMAIIGETKHFRDQRGREPVDGFEEKTDSTKMI